MSFIHLQIFFFQVGSGVGSGSRTGSGSVISEADPQIRFRIKMKRIRNTGINIYESIIVIKISFLVIFD